MNTPNTPKMTDEELEKFLDTLGEEPQPGVSVVDPAIDEQEAENGMPEEEATALLAAALDYARRGLAVLPLHTVDSRGRCTCGKGDCPSPGKHPIGVLVPNGVANATADEDTIRAWWSRVPYANIGIATGRVSGMSALDVDPGRGGNDSLARAIRDHGELPQTPTVETGSGGKHFWFKDPDTLLGGRKDFLPGLELKTDGGYVVAAPSRHKSGKAYRWLISPEDAPLAEMPEWLRKVGEEAKAASTAEEKNNHATVGNPPPNWSERVESDDVLARYWTQPLLHYRSLSEAAQAIANRLVQKYPDDTDPQRLAVLCEFYRVHKKAKGITALRKTLATAKAGAPQPEPESEPESPSSGEDETPPRPGGDDAYFISDDDFERLPPPKWLVDGILPEGAMATLVGFSGTGKSFIALDIALSVATGEPAFGKYAVKQGPVVYILAEGTGGFPKRIRAWKIDRDFKGRAGVRFRRRAVLLTNRNGPDAKALLAAITKLPEPPKLIVLDTQARCTVGADEDKTKDMSRFVEAIDHLREATGAAVLNLHHTGWAKENQRERGASAVRGATDTVMLVTQKDSTVEIECLKQKDAPEFGPITLAVKPIELDGGESSLVLRFVDGKPTPGGKETETMTQREKTYRDLIEGTLIEALEPLGAEGVWKRSGVPRSTCYKLLPAMVEAGQITRDETSETYSTLPEILAFLRREAAQQTDGVEDEHDGGSLH